MSIEFGHRNTQKPEGSTTDSWYGYTCGHCGSKVSGAVLASAKNATNSGIAVRWLQCSVCHKGSVALRDGTVYPGVAFGPAIDGLPDDVSAAYEEARRCLSVNADTAAETVCRKILMHIAVDKGAKQGAPFASYIDFLEKAGYVTPPMRDWVKLIKDHGNEANHKLPPPERQRAEGTVLFTAQLLRTVYEMGFLANQFTVTKPVSQ